MIEPKQRMEKFGSERRAPRALQKARLAEETTFEKI